MHEHDIEPRLFSGGEDRDSEPAGSVREPVAIVGIGCRFPRGVAGPDSFWRLLENGVDAIGDIPPDRSNVDEHGHYKPGKVNTHWGGFLDGIDKFDAAFFGVSPREAERMDPQQRLLLEVVWEALEDAGQPPDRLAGSMTGVFVGLWLNDYESRLFADPAQVDFYMTTGTGRYSASGRLSYALGLEGPSLTIDTACSSSLVAVHLACQSLRNGECSLALAGGANVILQPHIWIAYSQSGMMAADGRCKFADAEANGYVRSEGAGIVVLKPLSSAVRDGDRIYAVIRGSAVNNDGRTSGYMTTPSREGQQRMLRLAYRAAGISPGKVQYVEAHGTGTTAGDPVEVTALGNVLSSGRPAGSRCYIGSVKTNIGHTEGAAGIAGLIKTALVLKHRVIPPNLHLRRLNPVIPWKDYPLLVPREAVHLHNAGPAIAGVSSFGITGTNAHAVLTEAPRRAEGKPEHRAAACVLPLSARSPEALAALASAYVSRLDEADADSLSDICHSAAIRRSHHEYRLAAAAGSRAQMRGALEGFLRKERPSGVSTGRAGLEPNLKIVFVCPGQGSQWAGMGRQLLCEEPVFAAWIERCEQALRPYVDWSLHEQLHLDPGAARYRLNEIDVIQPSLFSIQIALAALWRSWGVEPHAVAGHSMGEAAAAYLAESLSLQDAARVICTRSRLMRRLSGQGAMAMVALTMDQARRELAGFEDRVSVAAANSPRSTVLSGDPRALGTILERVEAGNVFCRSVKVDVASHSPQVDVLTGELVHELEGIEVRRPAMAMYSTVTAQRVEGESLDAHYWARNLRCPVLFSETVQKLAADGHTLFIELSPHPVLTAAIEETAQQTSLKLYPVASLEKEKDEQVSLRSSLGRLYTIGYPVDWTRVFPGRGRFVPLPTYPWQRQRFWFEAKPRRMESARDALFVPSGGVHPLLGVRLPQLASQPGSIVWQKQLAAGAGPLSENTCIEMAWAAATAVFGSKLHGISVRNSGTRPDAALSAGGEMQSILDVSPHGASAFQLFVGTGGLDTGWKRVAAAEIERGEAEPDWFYDVVWKPKSLEHGIAAEAAPGCWLIFADRAGRGAATATALTARGHDCVLVFAGEAFERQGPARFSIMPGNADHFRKLLSGMAEDSRQACLGIVYFWGSDLREHACEGVLALVQSLVRMEWKTKPPRLWIVTTGAQAVEPGDGLALALGQAPLWGLGRVVGLEHPDFWGGLFDLAAGSAVEGLCEELLASDREDQVALRPTGRYIPRLERSRPAALKKPFRVLPDGTYLITGGLGNLGLHLARWLIARGARHLVLTSRTGLPDRCTWASISGETGTGTRIAAIKDMEACGATIYIAKADSGSRREMGELWHDLKAQHPPIRGIMHAAGILRPCDVAHLEAHEFREALRSKAMGAALLHEFTECGSRAGEALDFFVLFSSGASVWGSKGLAQYAAANQYLDALAHHRAALGLPALSINWGWWEGAGIVSDELAALFGSIGLKGLPADRGLAALRYLLETQATQKVVADVDWSVFLPIFEARRKRPLLERLAGSRDDAHLPARSAANEASSGGVQEAKRLPLLEEMEQAPASERKALLANYIRSQVADILGFGAPDRVDPRQGFFRMGMDSMMTVQLRNRLEATLGCALPPTLAFEYPTVESIAQFIDGTIVKPEPVASGAVSEFIEDRTDGAEAEDGEASEEELVALLAKKLEQIR